MDIVERLRAGLYDQDIEQQLSPLLDEAADEIERLQSIVTAYARICQKHGIAPSSSELIEAMKEKMMDYDRNIHHNPNAMAWAKFFVETTKDMGREVFCDESYMVGWFANAMMAMYESMKPHEAADEIERLREALTICDRVLHFNLRKMIIFGDDYNQAVKDAADAARSALQQKESE